MALALNKFKKHPYILNPLIVALDVDEESKALELAETLSDVAGAFKIGPRLIFRYGPSIISRVAKHAPVFVDHKFFDIPSTMESSLEAVFEAGASLATVHAMSGKTALSRLALLEAKLNEQRPFKILAVTVLTSWNSFSDEGTFFKTQEVKLGVSQLAEDVQAAGLSGLVCSGEELELFEDKNLFIVTPGVRRKKDASHDQSRLVTPGEALRNGASAVVVGRPIITAKDPRAEAMDFSLAMLGSSYI